MNLWQCATISNGKGTMYQLGFEKLPDLQPDGEGELNQRVIFVLAASEPLDEERFAPYYPSQPGKRYSFGYRLFGKRAIVWHEYYSHGSSNQFGYTWDERAWLALGGLEPFPAVVTQEAFDQEYEIRPGVHLGVIGTQAAMAGLNHAMPHPEEAAEMTTFMFISCSELPEDERPNLATLFEGTGVTVLHSLEHGRAIIVMPVGSEELAAHCVEQLVDTLRARI